MADIFISYASENRASVLMIARELRAHGLPLWIDENKIQGGSSWSAELVRALNGCRAVLLIVSRASLASPNVQREISYAAQRGKPIVPLHLEEHLEVPDKLAFWLAEAQFILARGEPDTWLERTKAALQSIGEPQQVDPAAGAKSSPNRSNAGIATALMPYLADRDEQERWIYTELEEHLKEQSGRPLLFFLHGERTQCIDGFLDRLGRHTLPRHLKRLGFPDYIERKHIPWPRPVEEPTVTSRDRARAYVLDVTDALELSSSASPEQIVTRINASRQSLVLTSQIHADFWPPGEHELIREVVRFWAGLPDGSPGQVVIILIAIAYPSSSNSFFSRLFAKPGLRPEVVKIPPLSGEFAARMSILLLPELASISQQEVKDWVRRHLQPDDIESAMQRLDRAYETQGLRADRSLPMERLLPMLKDLLPSITLRG